MGFLLEMRLHAARFMSIAAWRQTHVNRTFRHEMDAPKTPHIITVHS